MLLTQAYDEMMGHQYANTQQRINETSKILSKEFEHIREDWNTVSKDSNKIKIFGMKNEYKTDTAGVIDYESNAYGIAYLHEDETIKLGNSLGWYAGVVQNKFKFEDIGKSVEKQNMIKAGVFKTKSFDENGSLKMEYGRFEDIKEKSGEIRLEVEGNDYYSIKPEVGVEFKYNQPVAEKSMFTVSLGVAYENELGKVSDVENKSKVRFTEADYFKIRGEKEDKAGNFKADLKFGLENQRMGVTFNTGYDTKGENFRAGFGIRAIY